ncbi:MAG: hypothetical protein II822_00675, partial [Prevotella sp.]|nr:hypothetical protein [Prevotella sp.]
RLTTRGQAGNRARMHKIRCKDKHYFRTTKEILEKITICRVFIDFIDFMTFFENPQSPLPLKGVHLSL